MDHIDPFEESLQENVGFEGKSVFDFWKKKNFLFFFFFVILTFHFTLTGNEDPNKFEEFLEPEEYIDLGHLFTTDRIFSSKDELVDWAKQTALNANTYLIITRYQISKTLDRQPYVTLACERRVLRKIYNVVAKIKRNRMQGRNTIEEVLRLSAERGYTVFHINHEDNNVLSDIAIAHPTSIAIIRTEPLVILTDREGGLMSVIDDVFSNSYHMLCRRHFDQNMLVKLTEIVKDEETTNRTESEHSVLKLWLSTYHGNLDTVFLNIDHLKQGQINAYQMVEESGSNCLHYLRKSHGLPCACELVNRCQYLIPIQEEDVDIFWRKLEIGSDIPEEHNRDMESKMRDLTSLHCQPPPKTAVTKGRWKTNPTKRDKSHWEYVSIAHRKKGKSSGLGFRSDSGSGSGSNSSPRGRDKPPLSFPFNNAFSGFMCEFIQKWKNVVGEGNCRFRVVSNFLFGDENHWVEIRIRMSYDLRHRMNVYEQLFGSTNWEEGSAPPEYWMDTPDHLYVIANTFNLCVVFLAWSESTTVLPLVSNMDGTAGTIFIGLIEELQHFIQEFAGMTRTLVHDSVSKCEGASSHSASTKVFLKAYIILFGGRRAS
ncbi:hypothetical protein M9H77_31912 [Catharanthus roseus]|uniref:Uncharacterized protein n=1 Tax=Catharanthus roseus TaxID=4058 RepID=A0ACC0A395_CATRO|nr:hypothetical protein M9H77_31912 [Catharanthus roseus]